MSGVSLERYELYSYLMIPLFLMVVVAVGVRKHIPLALLVWRVSQRILASIKANNQSVHRTRWSFKRR